MSEQGKTMGNSALIKGVGAVLLALVLGFGTYIAAGVQRADEARSAVDVLRVEIRGELALIRADQQRSKEDLSAIRALMERRDK